MSTERQHNLSVLGIFIVVLALMIVVSLTSGCAVIRLSAASPDGPKAHGTLYAVDWPWRDLKQALSKANISVKTNAATISFKGDQESTINTNALNTLNKGFDFGTKLLEAAHP